MADNFSAHPGDNLLLRYTDGELTGRKRRQVAKHLEACWTCRAEAEQLQSVMSECVRYRQHVLAENLPPVPTPWRDLYRDFDRIDSDSHAKPNWFSSVMRSGGFRWVATAAAAAIASFAVYHQFEQAPSVKAAALLQRAMVAAQARPALAHHVRVRSSRGPAGALPLFQLAKYDGVDPLTARAYREWRDGLTQKSDEFSYSSGMYHLRTSTVDGAVSAASLTVRGSDLEPVEGRLDFRNREWIEFSESDLSEPTTTDSVASGSTHVGVPPRSAVPSRPAAVVPGSTASISDELQILAALHRIGADLGDPVQVSLHQDQVLVSGVGIAPQRQRQIQAALAGLPRAGIQFSEPSLAQPSASAPTAPPAQAPVLNPYEARLEAQIGGKASADKFVSQILEWNEAAMARAYALRALAQRFPSDSGLSESDRALLRNMAAENAAGLSVPLGNTEHTLGAVLVRMGATDSGAGAISGNTWQEAAQEVFRAARRVDSLSSLLLGAAPGDNADSDLPSELLRAVSRLQADLDECQRLLRR
jgi:hypothetical protein